MPFLKTDIDRAIVVTQFDLRGYEWNGARDVQWNPKNFEATTANLIEIAAGLWRGHVPTDPSYVDFYASSFADTLTMCNQLIKDCDQYQKEAIQLIIREFIKQHKEKTAEVAAGTRKHSFYMGSLDQNNRWGRLVLALCEAFEVNPTA